MNKFFWTAKKNIDKNRYISFNLINFWIFFLTFTTLTQKYFQWICLEKKVDRKLKRFNPNYDISCIWKSITTLNQMIKDLHLEWMDLIIIKWRWTWYYHIIDIVTIFFKNSIHSTTTKKSSVWLEFYLAIFKACIQRTSDWFKKKKIFRLIAFFLHSPAFNDSD